MKSRQNRRQFLKLAGLGSATLALEPGRKILANNLKAIDDLSLGAPSALTVAGMRCDALPVVRIAIIGLGMRGEEAVRRLILVEHAEIKAICDVVPEKVQAANKQITNAGLAAAIEYTGDEDWKTICQRDDIDLVYQCTPWQLHTPISVYAMDHGKHAAVEVPAATSLQECWDLVNASERNRRHCMMLENCCYDFFELNTLNMARQGVFGEIMHAEGAYIHDLRWLKFMEKGGYHNLWRLEYSKYHTGNLYPTHGLGPVAQIMGINRGDRFDYLTSVSTRQYGMSAYAKEKFGPDSAFSKQTYQLGDMNTTVISTLAGRTIMVQHDTTSPRPYSRIHRVSGSKGMAVKWPEESIALEPNAHEFLKKEELDALMKKYEHPLVTQIGEKAKKVGGHGGMDFIMDCRLIHCLHKGLALDQDVYDAAAWSSLIPLSEASVLNRGNSVDVPDFTRGAWKDTAPLGIVSFDE